MNEAEFKRKAMEITNLAAGFLIVKEKHFLDEISSLIDDLLENGEEYFEDED